LLINQSFCCGTWRPHSFTQTYPLQLTLRSDRESEKPMAVCR
jgi:hypothetical protein